MSINSVSRSPVSIPTQQTQQAPAVAPEPMQKAEMLAPKSNPIQDLLKGDSFGPAGKGGLAELTKGLEQLTQTLNKVMELLGGQGAQGPGQGAGGNSGIVPPGMGGGAEGGVPDLGGAGGVPDLGAQAGAAAPAQAGAAAPAAQGAGPAETSGAGPTAGAPTAGATGKKASSNGNTMDFTNDGTKPMEIKFTPNAGGQPIDSITLKPGESMTKEFPEGWSGNFRSTAGDGTAATLGEVAFNGGSGNTYYDVSYIEGNNASMTIAPESGGRVSGTMDNLVANAPDSIKAKNADGSAYGIKKTTTSDVQDASVVDYYRKNVGEAQGYVVPKDDASTLGTADKHLSVHLKDVF